MNHWISNAGKVWASVSNRGVRHGLNDALTRWSQSKLTVPFDVMRNYGWALNQENPAKLPVPTSGPLRINWLLPGLDVASGGALNIFRTIHHLEEWGFINRVYILEPPRVSKARIHELVENSYFPVKAPIEVFAGYLADSDALVATAWKTAYTARAISNTARKFYFVQDLEYLFYPEGSVRELAKQTYLWGFCGITLGPWIAENLDKEFGMPCTPFNFSCDKDIYFSRKNSDDHRRENRVLFYARPSTERRGFECGVLALFQLLKSRPQTEIVVVGCPSDKIQLPFSAVLPGILSPTELAEVYRSCSIALVLSHTNPSMLPLELMACGCAVVSNSGRNVECLLNDENAQLAVPTPAALCDAMLALLENDQARERKVAAGHVLVNSRDWVSEIRTVGAAFYRGLGIDCTLDRRDLNTDVSAIDGSLATS
jgi:O-antigen biosynthesis protein